ncbi:MAG: chemotaxis protein CheD [Candidatus Riflebacteria bacterium]|jgi:chemotaxis receptor (MCP) glutamine deamidase CheD|nr:chemotaxis protein CheD [Candidatus Riflebacteria bacterium]
MSGLTIPKIHVNIGKLHACRGKAVLNTLLGSCVSACLFDPEAGVAGMNHILLVHNPDVAHFDASTRYGIHAMEILINEMLKLGARRSRINAKAFGGGNVLAMGDPENTPGQRNVEFLLNFLHLENIPLLAYDFGGPWTRVIDFHTDTYEVFVKKTQKKLRDSTIAEETRFKTEVVQDVDREEGGEITLFDD